MQGIARWLVRLAMLGGLAVMPAVHAQSTARAIAFTEVARGDTSTAGAAMLRFATDSRRRAALVRLAGDPQLTQRLAAFDWRDRTLVAVFVGPMASSGHGVAVKDVRVQGQDVRITVQLTAPAADRNVNDVISYPYAFVAVSTSELPTEARWSVTGTNGREIVSRWRLRDRR